MLEVKSQKLYITNHIQNGVKILEYWDSSSPKVLGEFTWFSSGMFET